MISRMAAPFGASHTSEPHTIEDVYIRYRRLMFSTAGKYTADKADQEDIVQTALERLIKIFSASPPPKRCISAEYIVYTVRSVSVDYLRKKYRQAVYQIPMEEHQLAEIAKWDHTLDDLLLASEAAEQFWAVWLQLSSEDRLLLEGKYLLGQKDEALAAILKCKPSSIRMKRTRARRRAAKLLSERTWT